MKNLIGKILINGEIEVATGLHIGGSSDFASIGAVDSVVIKDPITKQPIIPGSSLKGKLRTLLAKYSDCLDEPNKDSEEIKRLFGSSEKNNIIEARLQFYDLFLSNADELKNANLDLSYTEIKFENNIDRKKIEANPRQLERVPKGAKFEFKLIYNVEDNDEIEEDFNNLKQAIELLENDYLGGSGTRGYGKVKFNNLESKAVIGEINDIPSLQD